MAVRLCITRWACSSANFRPRIWSTRPSPGVQPRFANDLVPVRQFTNNVGYASHIGLTVRYHLQNATAGQTSLFENSTFWNNNLGIDLPYAQNLVLRNLKVISGQITKPDVGVSMNNIDQEHYLRQSNCFGIQQGHPYYHGEGIPLSMAEHLPTTITDIVIVSAAIENRSVLITGNLVQPKIQIVYSTLIRFLATRRLRSSSMML